jgi:hypothetical protein
MAIVFTILLVGGITWFALYTVDPEDLEQDGYLSWSLLLSLALGLVHYCQCVSPTLATFEHNNTTRGPGHGYCTRSFPSAVCVLGRVLGLRTAHTTRSSVVLAGDKYYPSGRTKVISHFTLNGPASSSVFAAPTSPTPSPMSSPTINATTPMTFTSSKVWLHDPEPFSLDEILTDNGTINYQNAVEPDLSSTPATSSQISNPHCLVTNISNAQQERSRKSGRLFPDMSWSSWRSAPRGEGSLDRPTRGGSPATSFSGRSTSVVSSLKADNVLGQVLHNDSLRALFMAHLSSELSSENLLFWEEVRFWKNQFRNLGKTPAFADASTLRTNQYKMFKRAQAIHKTFVRKNAPLQVNLSAENTRKLDRVLDGDARVIKLSTFDKALREIERLMQADGLSRFARRVDLNQLLHEYQGPIYL